MREDAHWLSHSIGGKTRFATFRPRLDRSEPRPTLAIRTTLFILLTLLVSVLWLAICAVVMAMCHTAARGAVPGQRPAAVPEQPVLHHPTVGRDKPPLVA